MFDLYNNAYANYASDPYRQVRIETYGQDFGQTSWVTTKESLEIPQLLSLERRIVRNVLVNQGLWSGRVLSCYESPVH